jgi:hypothetical protein
VKIRAGCLALRRNVFSDRDVNRRGWSGGGGGGEWSRSKIKKNLREIVCENRE